MTRARTQKIQAKRLAATQKQKETKGKTKLPKKNKKNNQSKTANKSKHKKKVAKKGSKTKHKSKNKTKSKTKTKNKSKNKSKGAKKNETGGEDTKSVIICDSAEFFKQILLFDYNMQCLEGDEKLQFCYLYCILFVVQGLKISSVLCWFPKWFETLSCTGSPRSVLCQCLLCKDACCSLCDSA